MSEHTPGPWKADKMGSYIWGPHVGDGEMVAQLRGYGYMKGLCDMTEDEIEARMTANANLIAAAPDLLEALAEVEEILRFDSEDHSIALRKLRAAIAKARGEA